ncbi:ribonuclease inhibitor-like [Chanodichthys erythropterus]|uniref:ribonuclease inhibitor-like n=1 Tax=Chanodichthys erythropterus TaxID=933992 RepID=UPI00351E5105
MCFLLLSSGSSPDQQLPLEDCRMTDEGFSAVTSALKSNPSHLRQLDLSQNELGDSGGENLCGLLMNPQCKLGKTTVGVTIQQAKGLCRCSITEKQCLILT